MKKIRKETGSITLMVLITLLFFMVVLSSIYIVNASRRASQLQEIERIRKIYETDIENIEQVYNEVVNRTNKIGYKQNGLYLYLDAKRNTRSEYNAVTTTWEDLSGKNRDTTLMNFNGNNTSGWKEQSLSLDGTDDYITTGISQKELGNSFTISTLIYTSETEDGRGILGQYSTRADGGVDGILAQWEGGNLKVGYGLKTISIPEEKMKNKWASLTIVIKSGQEIEVYLNGVSYGKVTTTETITLLDNLWIGRSQNGAGKYFSGQMNNFLIYTEALTAEEIQNNYNTDRKQYGLLDNEYIQKGIVAQYDGINNTGRGHNIESSIWKDLSGNGYDAQKTGTEAISWESNNYHFTNTVHNYFCAVGKQMNLGTNARTVEIVYSLENNVDQTMLGLGTMETGKMQDIGYINGGFNCQGYGTAANEGIAITYERGKIYSSSWTYENGKASYRTNGETKENVTFPSLNTASNYLRIGMGQGTASTSDVNFKVYAVRIYDRVLIQEEMKYNYEIDKKRFEIVTGPDVPIPDGFYAVGGEIETGFIISDESVDEGKGTGWDIAKTLVGNQFVWIPVELPLIDATIAGTNETSIAKVITDSVDQGKGIYPMAVKLADGTYRGILYNVNSDGTFTPITYSASGRREPDSLKDNTYGDGKSGVLNGLGVNNTNLTLATWKTQLQNEYKAMIDSVVTNKGFYVARYEASLATNDKLESKQGKTVIATTNWWDLYKKAKTLNTSASTSKTGMLWGSQWDQIMIYLRDVKNIKNTSKLFILDSTEMAKYNSSQAAVSGSNSNYGAKEIYDLAGNVYDWTIEGYATNIRTLRGGSFYAVSWAKTPASSRTDDYPSSVFAYTGVRVMLYL